MSTAQADIADDYLPGIQLALLCNTVCTANRKTKIPESECAAEIFRSPA